ncbi:hypothetical protein [Vibrio paucivorans]|uniref:Uncharacterized protein n=1 Tax=Vibrio paucivorans TaxID=2829489 RepID=A0A9X3HSC1_9VIBR|nr:hypothetical protein [Vibrio paucivorans]MCW8334870.1 hypothetical protein [Vibrio paucivorans]
MPVSGVQSGYQVIEQSNKMAEEAALEIAQQQSIAPVELHDKSLEFNKIDDDSPPPLPSSHEPLIKLGNAQHYNRIGTNMLQREQDMIGSLLDIHV